MRIFVILSFPILLMLVFASGASKTSEVAAAPRLVTSVQFSVTTLPQEKSGGLNIGIGNFTSPSATLTSRPGSQITLEKGFVFLLVKASVSARAGQKVSGADYYLIDGGGEKNIGFYNMSPFGWVNGGASWEYNKTRMQTEEFLYSVKADRVVGSVFHFLDAQVRVSDYPPEAKR